MDDLIKLLEAMTGPARSVDVEIGRLQGVLVMQHDEETGTNREHTCWKYTESIDAALTLVPEGTQWTIEPDAAWVRWLTEEDVGEAQGFFLRSGGKCTALALCIAALKARRDMTKTRLKSQQ